MARLRLRTQLLIATLVIICALLGSLLLIVRHTVRSEIDEGVQESTNESLRAFESVRQERELQLSRTAAMLAELPPLKALMTTEHALTIQDASEPLWKLAGSQLFLLAGPDGHVLGFHGTSPRWKTEVAEENLARSMREGEDAAWWYGEGQLYRVFLRPITSGAEAERRQLGILAVGYQIDATVAEQLALVSGSQIALTTGDKIIASTLSAADQSGAYEFDKAERRRGDRHARNGFGLGSIPGGFGGDSQGAAGLCEMLRTDVSATGERVFAAAEPDDSAAGNFGGGAGGAVAGVCGANDYASVG